MADPASNTPTQSAPTHTCVIGVGITEDKNYPHRRRMEDAHTFVDKFGGDDSSGFFGVYDGHGGRLAAQFCQTHLHKLLLEELEALKGGEPTQQSFQNVYQRTDEAMKDTVPGAGACVVTVLLKKYDGKRILFVANAGDARAVLSRGGKATQLTHDHTAKDEAEAKAITDKGGFIKGGNVNGLIAVTRALGDLHMKKYLSNEPYFTRTELTAEDEFLIVACDGVWDVVSNQNAVDFIKEDSDASLQSKKTISQSQKRR